MLVVFRWADAYGCVSPRDLLGRGRRSDDCGDGDPWVPAAQRAEQAPPLARKVGLRGDAQKAEGHLRAMLVENDAAMAKAGAR